MLPEENADSDRDTFSFGEIIISVKPPLRLEDDGAMLFSDQLDEEGADYDDTGLFGVWPASVALCRFLQQHPAMVLDKRVLELGCGAALPSLLCARIGAAFTLSTDRNEHVVQRVIDAQHYATISSDRATARVLDWKSTEQLSEVVREAEIDLVIAADLVGASCKVVSTNGQVASPCSDIVSICVPNL